jgi:hypothetical protein
MRPLEQPGLVYHRVGKQTRGIDLSTEVRTS